MKIRGDSRKSCAAPARVGMVLLTTALVVGGVGGSGAEAALSGQCGTIASIAAPASIVPGSLEDNNKLQLVTEARQKTLTKELSVDFTQPGLYNGDVQLPLPSARPTISAGTVVSSFLIHSDPVGLANPGQRLSATVNFTSDILGVMAQNDRSSTLSDADLEVGATGVIYPAVIKERGLEMSSNPSVVVDWVRLSARSIQVSVLTSTVVDEVRVITAGAGDATGPAAGYQMVASDGGVFSFGNREDHGSTGAQHLNSPVVAASSPCTGGGYWLAAADGGVFAFDAPYLGSMGNTKLNKPIVGMSSTPTGNGYWLVASDGGIFAFGDAGFFQSMGGKPLNQPIVGMLSSKTGKGYWLVASDGGIFAFGDAASLGSLGNQKLNSPIVGMASTPTGNGYWLVASDGGIFAFGDAGFFQSMGGKPLNQPIVGMVVSPSGEGYWLAAADGGIFSFGDAKAYPFYGSMGGEKLNRPIVTAL